MSFVRKKEIRKKNGKKYSYFYLVSSHRQGNHVRQKVEKYLGRQKPSSRETQMLF